MERSTSDSGLLMLYRLTLYIASRPVVLNQAAFCTGLTTLMISLFLFCYLDYLWRSYLIGGYLKSESPAAAGKRAPA